MHVKCIKSFTVKILASRFFISFIVYKNILYCFCTVLDRITVFYIQAYFIVFAQFQTGLLSSIYKHTLLFLHSFRQDYCALYTSILYCFCTVLERITVLYIQAYFIVFAQFQTGLLSSIYKFSINRLIFIKITISRKK